LLEAKKKEEREKGSGGHLDVSDQNKWLIAMPIVAIPIAKMHIVPGSVGERIATR
jgi:hypothetical protein